MKKAISIILLLAMMLGLCACGNNDSEGNTPTKDVATQENSGDEYQGNNDTSEDRASENTIDAGAMTLTEMGTVPNGVNFVSNGILTKSDGTKVQILNQNGNSFNDKWYDAVEYIIRDGICVVGIAGTNQTLLGVVDAVAEKELAPCEAVTVSPLSDRFVMLAYATGTGTADDHVFAIGSTDGESYYYKGYGKILDLQKGEFIPNLELTTRKELQDTSAVGNVIFVEKDSLITDVYGADGTFMGTYEYIYAYPQSGIALQFAENSVCVYDENMNLVSTLPKRDYGETYDAVEGSSELLIHRGKKDNGEEWYSVIDLTGKALTAEYKWITSVYYNGFMHVTKDGVSCIVDFAGNTIISDFMTASYVEPGYFMINQNNEYYVYDLTGKKLNDVALSEARFGTTLKDDSGKLFIFETGETLAVEGRIEKLTGSLVLIGSNVYDVITGKIVLSDVDACLATGGNLYVWDNDKETYTRYIAEYASKG